jgi:hypothetical protein
MKTRFLPSICIALALAVSAQAQLQTQLGDVKDTRTTGKFFAGLEVEIKLLGDALADAQSMRLVVKTAVDDTGRDLVDHEKEDRNNFEKANNRGRQGTALSLNLKNPARKATTIKELSGNVEVYAPKNDPAAVVKVEGFQKLGGTPIVSPALTAAGVEITTYTKEQSDAIKAKKAGDAKKGTQANVGETISEAFGGMFGMGGGPNDITVQSKDPNEKIVDMEFQDASGKKVKGNGWSATNSNGTKTKTFNFPSKLPDSTALVIYLSTPKSMVEVPFALKDVFLP